MGIDDKPDVERDFGKQLAEGMYWAMVTMSSVGYGDSTPKTNEAKIVSSLYMFVAVPLIALVLKKIADVPREMANASARKQFLDSEQTDALLDGLDSDGSGSISQAEFVLFML